MSEQNDNRGGGADPRLTGGDESETAQILGDDYGDVVDFAIQTVASVEEMTSTVLSRQSIMLMAIDFALSRAAQLRYLRARMEESE